LRLLDASAQITPFNSFIIPQWGGVIILNPETSQDEHLHSIELNAAFSTFRAQLSSLLGIHQLPSNIDDSRKDQPISDWQLDSLMRRRLLETISATQETLSSIIKLVDQIENMPVGLDVKNDIQDSLDYMHYVGYIL
jgi:GPI-anchor transamidase subunit S